MSPSFHLYTDSMTNYRRRRTRVVNIGDTPLGGDYPIRVQSMTITNTMDTMGVVSEAIRMADAGCEYVRITAPSMKEAQNLENIKKELRSKGYNVPLIADIHFTPNAAELAARIVEKVRINPGNYADKKRFENIDYTDAGYRVELDRIREKFIPLIQICKEYGTAMRIGANHGSLSDRILSRYGDTPLGMVESALEFVRICEACQYYDIVLSMKASNPQVTTYAYRLLAQRLQAEQLQPYPFHLGVTEAGDGEDGRIKSAIGIGALLEDGIGDTIRVSLTEAPEAEIQAAQALVAKYNGSPQRTWLPEIEDYPINPYAFERRKTDKTINIGAKCVPIIVADFSRLQKITPSMLFGVGYRYSVPLDKWHIADQACDYLYIGDNNPLDFALPGTLGVIQEYNAWQKSTDVTNAYFPAMTAAQYLSQPKSSSALNFVRVCYRDITGEFVARITQDPSVTLWLAPELPHQAMVEMRRIIVALLNADCRRPVLLSHTYEWPSTLDDFLQRTSTDIGSLFIDGLGDGIFLRGDIPVNLANKTAFGILQATRMRISKTEYISCPSCGRTLFDLQETTAKIRVRTNHLKGVKIGIMGCIVNGPGEMADADYGYVGAGPNRITLYRGKEVVERNLPADQAVDRLINLIKEDGQWRNPPELDQELT